MSNGSDTATGQRPGEFCCGLARLLCYCPSKLYGPPTPVRLHLWQTIAAQPQRWMRRTGLHLFRAPRAKGFVPPTCRFRIPKNRTSESKLSGFLFKKSIIPITVSRNKTSGFAIQIICSRMPIYKIGFRNPTHLVLIPKMAGFESQIISSRNST